MRYRFLRYPGGRTKAVTFSFDDGCRDDIRFSDAITRCGIRCTFNINGGQIEKETGKWRLTADEIREYILDRGHEIAVHGQQHRASGAIRPIDVIREVLECRDALENTFGMIIRGMAYPDSGITKFHNGNDWERVRRCLEDTDIVYSRTLAGDNDSFMLPNDWLAWMPTAHCMNPDALSMAAEFDALDVDGQYCASRYPRLFYLWGHSFEFERAGNWELLDELCESLGGREDVWYATNMEIYDYVKAYEALSFSADGRRVYNPGLQSVWFDADGTLHCIASGETKVLE